MDKLKSVSYSIVSMWRWTSVCIITQFSHKYGIRMTEKGLKWPKEPDVIQSDTTTIPKVAKN